MGGHLVRTGSHRRRRRLNFHLRPIADRRCALGSRGIGASDEPARQSRRRHRSHRPFQCGSHPAGYQLQRLLRGRATGQRSRFGLRSRTGRPRPALASSGFDHTVTFRSGRRHCPDHTVRERVPGGSSMLNPTTHRTCSGVGGHRWSWPTVAYALRSHAVRGRGVAKSARTSSPLTAMGGHWCGATRPGVTSRYPVSMAVISSRPRGW